MATITIRFSSGDEQTWTLHDAMDLGGLVKSLARAAGGVSSFGVASEGGTSADFGFVGLRMEEVASWHIDGMLDPNVAAALAAELQAFESDEK